MPAFSLLLDAVALAAAVPPGPVAWPIARPVLPPLTERPLAIDFDADPLLAIARTAGPTESFRAAIAAAVERNPATAESRAIEDVASAQRDGARAAQRPSVDATVTSFRTIARAFSNDPQNIIERSRPRQRTDVLLAVQQSVFDFGAGDARVAAAGARIRASAADAETAADDVALQTIAAWYDVFGYRALIGVTDASLGTQRLRRGAIAERIALGASAQADLARIDSVIASGEVRRAQYRRRLDNAEARFETLAGTPPPAGLQRAPVPAIGLADRDAAAGAAADRAAVRSAQANADAARQDARAADRDRLPQVSVGIDAGRYGVFENDRDYDVRGRVAIRQRLFGGIGPRANEQGARARAADARAQRVAEEARREAAIAYADVAALERQLAALAAAYRASRTSRDVTALRFEAARGNLFDVVAAEDAYTGAASSFVEALIQLDASRYVLLSRTGRLLDALAIRTDGATVPR